MLKENTNCHELPTNYSYNINVSNMKKEYMKPEQRVVVLRHRTMLLSGSGPVGFTSTNLSSEDDFEIEDTPNSDWGR